MMNDASKYTSYMYKKYVLRQGDYIYDVSGCCCSFSTRAREGARLGRQPTTLARAAVAHRTLDDATFVDDGVRTPRTRASGRRDVVRTDVAYKVCTLNFKRIVLGARRSFVRSFVRSFRGGKEDDDGECDAR